MTLGEALGLATVTEARVTDGGVEIDAVRATGRGVLVRIAFPPGTVPVVTVLNSEPPRSRIADHRGVPFGPDRVG